MFQHQSNFDAPQNINATPGLVHSADPMQTNMVANQYPGELGVVNRPGQTRQGLAQTRQKFHRLHHRKNSQASPHNPKPLSFLAGTSSTALERKSLGWDEHFSVSESKEQSAHPLLYTLLKQKSLTSGTIQGLINIQPSSSVETNANIEHNISPFLDERHNKSQQMKSSLAARNYEQTRRQNLDHLEGTNVTFPQLQVSSPFLSGHSPNAPPTDEQILDFIEKRLEHYRLASTQQSRKDDGMPFNAKWKFCTSDRDAIIHSYCNIPESNGVVHLPTTSASNEENVERQRLSFSVIEQYTAAGGQALKEDSSKSSKANTALALKSKVAGDCATVASDKHSTGTLTPAVEHSHHGPKNESVKSVSIDYNLPVKKHLDVSMLANADGKLVYSDDCGDKTCVGSNNEKFHSKMVDKYVENDVATLHYSLTALKELIASLENVEIIAKVDNFSEVILQQYWNGDIGNIHVFTSTEYPQIMMNVAATCTKNEDESPVVLTAVSGTTFDEPTEKRPSSTSLSCGSTQEEYRSPWLNINKYLDDIDNMSGVSRALNSTTEQEKGETDPKVVEAVRLNSVEGVTDVSVEFQTKSSSVVSKNNTLELKSFIEMDSNTNKEKNTEDPQHFQITCKEVTAHSEINSSIQILNIMSLPANQSCEDTRRNAHSVYTQSELSLALSENKGKDSPPDQKAHSVNYLKDPQYEDISDDDCMSQLGTKQPRVKDLQYEDISEDEEPQIKNMALETASLIQVSENNNEHSTFKCEGYGHLLDEAPIEVISDKKLIPEKQVLRKTETVDIAQHCSSIASEGFAESDNGFEHLSSSKCDSKKHLGQQTSQPVSYSPSSVLKENETDNQMEDNDDDDDWIIIPVSIVDIEFEPEEPDEEQDIELVVLHPGKTEVIERWDATSPKQGRLHQPTPEPAPAASPSQIEVFDTFDSFVKAKSEQFGYCRTTLLNKPDPDGEPQTTQNGRESHSEPEDSYETEDSCDYSSASEHNHLTVARRLLEREMPAPPDTDNSLSERETEHKATNKQIGQTQRSRLHKLKELLAARVGSRHAQSETNRQKVSEMDDIIILDSDTDDESDQNCKKKAKRKRLLSSGSQDSEGSLRHASGRNVSVQQSVIILDSDTDSSGSVDDGNTRKSGQLTETKEHIHRETNRPTTLKRTVSHDSNEVVKKDHFCKKKPTVERTVSSGSDQSSTTSFAAQNEPATETVNRPYGTTSKKPKKNTRSSKDSSDKLPRSVGKNTDSANPVIVRLFFEEPSQSSSYLKLSKESKGRLGKDETQAPKTPTATKSTSENDRQCATNSKANVTKPKPASRQISFSNHEGPSTFISSSTSGSQRFSQVRQRSASDGLSQSVGSSALSSLAKSKPSTSVPTQQLSSSKLKCSHSDGNTSTLEHPHALTKDSSSATTQSFARKRVRNDWHMSFVPTKMDRKPSLVTEEPLRTVSRVSSREVRPGPSHKTRAPRQRHSSQKSATPLMKRTKLEAIQRTKDINRTTLSGQSVFYLLFFKSLKCIFLILNKLMIV